MVHAEAAVVSLVRGAIANRVRVEILPSTRGWNRHLGESICVDAGAGRRHFDVVVSSRQQRRVRLIATGRGPPDPRGQGRGLAPLRSIRPLLGAVAPSARFSMPISGFLTNGLTGGQQPACNDIVNAIHFTPVRLARRGTP